MSDIQAIEIPKWGMTMEEGFLDSWHIAEGAEFHAGDPLCTIESSKISNELEAPFDGVMRRYVAEPGVVLPVGSLIAVSAPVDVSDAEIDAFIASRQPSHEEPPTASVAAKQAETQTPASAPTASPVPRAAAQKAAAPRPSPGALMVPEALRGSSPDVFATPRAAAFAAKHGVDLAKVSGTGTGGRVGVKDIEDAIRDGGGQVPAQASAPRQQVRLRSHGDDSLIEATPLARRLAQASGINLHDCRATGSRGRVCRADVEEAIRRLNAGEPLPEPQDSAPELNEVTPVPFTAMRRVIAQRLQASYQTSPHFRVSTEIELDEALALRRQINAAVPAVRISVNDLVVKAVGLALTRVPEVNVQFDEATETVLRFADADVSIAVSLPDGLITPVVRGVNRRSLGEVSAEVTDLATRAKAGTLAPDEFQGGTFTVSNLGMYGVTSFDAIINPPQSAILAVSAGIPRPVVGPDGAVVVRTVMQVSLSSDHRVIDGALAARFVAELRDILQAPTQMLV